MARYIFRDESKSTNTNTVDSFSYCGISLASFLFFTTQ